MRIGAAQLALLACVCPLAAQEGPTATLSADTVAVAEVFELQVEVRVPEGNVVYFPDTLPASPSIESFAPVDWGAERGPDGGATLTLAYALQAFGEGPVMVPGLEVLTSPASEATPGEPIAGSSVVGYWTDATAAPRFSTAIPERMVWVEYVHSQADIVRGVSPRPPGDVMGFSWSVPALGLLLLFSSVIGGAVVVTTKDWLAHRARAGRAPPAGPMTLEEARLLALAELDRLLAAMPHAWERVQELYMESSAIMRRYVERLDPDWGPDLTSTELMARLDTGASATARLREEMESAELVKFGRSRPGAGETEGHLRSLRAWLDARGEVGP